MELDGKKNKLFINEVVWLALRVLILGCGNIGSVAAEDLSKEASIELIVADKLEGRAKAVAERVGRDNTSWSKIDASDALELRRALRDFELVLGFLPGHLGYGLANACIDSGVNLIDVSYMPEDPMTLDERAVEAGVTIIPDCGVAPGLSNILVGRTVQRLDEVHSIHILVGGIPSRAEPPLGYTITWSPEDLLDEYTRKVRIVREGRLTEVEPLTGLENIDFPGVGLLEAFYTDGLRTLLKTVRAWEMWEKTLRYPGHVEKIRLLRDLGFLDGESIEIEGLPIPIKRLTARILERKLYRPKVEDILVMKVEVSGVRRGEENRYTHYLLDRYDKERGITAMARTTAYTATSIAKILISGVELGRGIRPPEFIGADERVFKLLLNRLEEHGIKIKSTEGL